MIEASCCRASDTASEGPTDMFQEYMGHLRCTPWVREAGAAVEGWWRRDRGAGDSPRRDGSRPATPPVDPAADAKLGRHPRRQTGSCRTPMPRVYTAHMDANQARVRLTPPETIVTATGPLAQRCSDSKTTGSRHRPPVCAWSADASRRVPVRQAALLPTGQP